MNYPNFINSKILSEKLNMPVTAIQRLVREGKLPAYKIDNKQYLFNYEEVYKIIMNRKVN
ncbi:MAG: helix-turn-helix domain-containing protein [Leptospirales bacterium]|nr:helix-turn-helix domain-containing protein [Leptospirales bacterium]